MKASRKSPIKSFGSSTVTTIKEKSLSAFLEKHSTESIRRGGEYDVVSLCSSFSRNIELILKKDFGFCSGDSIVFELQDYTQQSRIGCTNKYTFVVEEYDSFSLRAKLVNHELITEEPK